MTKRQPAKIIRDVFKGDMYDSYGIIYKIGRSWIIETSTMFDPTIKCSLKMQLYLIYLYLICM